ncbi:MAG: class I SAM-dependent methyltransferase [Planctomycetota bacterium]
MQESVHEEHLNTDHWWFRARRTIFARVLDDHFRREGTPRILDLGPGSGVNNDVLVPRGRVTALDLSPISLARCIGDLPIDGVLADATRTPFLDGSFDLVCALDVIEHIDDEDAIVAEARRVVAPDGLFLFSVPAYQFLWSRQDVLNHHKRRYTRPRLRALVERHGFHIEHLTYFNTLLFPPIAAFRLLSKPFTRRHVEVGTSDLSVGTPLGLDRVLYGLFAGEGGWVTRRSLPFGVSILGWARPR